MSLIINYVLEKRLKEKLETEICLSRKKQINKKQESSMFLIVTEPRHIIYMNHMPCSKAFAVCTSLICSHTQISKKESEFDSQ